MLTRLAAFTLFFLTFCSCEKQEINTGFITVGEVFFDASDVALNKIGQGRLLQVRYNGHFINWEGGAGRIRVPEGEANFEFYDSRNDEVLAEKTVNVIKGSPESFRFFQPSLEDPLAFLEPDGQANEEAAPDGFMKIRIANYAGALIPYDELDVIVVGLNRSLVNFHLDTLESVSRNLGEAEYKLVPIGGSDILGYTFKFINKTTGVNLKGNGGDDYWNRAVLLQPSRLQPAPVKRVYTIYLIPFQRTQNAMYIKSGDNFYDVNPQILSHN